MSVTVNAFPPVHAFNSSRGWALALIALIHVGFLWALTSGLARSILQLPPPVTKAFIEEAPRPTPPPPRNPADPPLASQVFIPDIPLPTPLDDASDTAPRIVTHDPRPSVLSVTTQPERPGPVEVAPQIDARRGLSEPVYPSALIRQGIEGTVVLSVQVLENGRVGEVRIERSSGQPKLDESALREARKWRLIPGTRDGVPVVLWKQIPITFRLQD
ncbi:energy transducer TonB [Povalibacter sp.]|uniref:energy transducer TonB n=1 Tax=Povalibacter sp. TaxID=1962978 RepID=UPI002F428A72